MYFCVCMCVCVCMRVYCCFPSECVISQELSTMFLKSGSPTGMWYLLTQLGLVASDPRGFLPFSAFPALGLQAHMPILFACLLIERQCFTMYLCLTKKSPCRQAVLELTEIYLLLPSKYVMCASPHLPSFLCDCWDHTLVL